jgi:hypothetical protein
MYPAVFEYHKDIENSYDLIVNEKNQIQLFKRKLVKESNKKIQKE